MFVHENKALLLFQFKEQMFNLGIESECEFRKSKSASPMNTSTLVQTKEGCVRNMLNGQLKSSPQKSHEKVRNFLMTSSMVFFI